MIKKALVELAAIYQDLQDLEKWKKKNHRSSNWACSYQPRLSELKKKNELPSVNWACSHEPRLRKLKKTPATKLQLSL
jgi:hypothetical protein